MRRDRSWAWALALAAALVVVAPAARADEAPDLYQQSYDLEAEGKLSESLGALERVPTAQQSYVFQLRRAWLLYLLARHADAIEAYQRAIAAAPNAIEPRLGLMLPQIAQRRWLDVEKSAQEVLKRDPQSYLATSRLAWAYYNLGRYADAAPLYKKLVDAYPSDVEMRAGLGWSTLKLGRAGEAAALFREVLAIAPRHASAKEGLRASGVVK